MQSVSPKASADDSALVFANLFSTMDPLKNQSRRVVFILFLLIQTGVCLQCYECFSSLSGNCGVEFNPTAAAKEFCREVNPFCFLSWTTIKGIPTGARGCGKPDYCVGLEECTICDRDFCNSSSIVTSSVVAIVSLIMAHCIWR